MDYNQIKKLIDDMGDSKLTSLEIDFPDGTKISMKKEEKEVVTKISEVSSSEKEVEAEVAHEEKIEAGNIIASPMVGTFYSKPSPDAKPYVEVGSKVSKGNVVCIVEAMKLMNEIESEFDGEIAEIYIKDGEPVDYGKPLFRVK